MKPSTIAIDGPAASGKSTLAQKMAAALDYLFFDTGVMYRAVTWAVYAQNADFNDAAVVTHIAETVDFNILPASKDDGRDADIVVDGVDITWAIRQPEVDGKVSVVAAYPGVRRALTAQQRRIGLRGRVVMVGRDIGTVVLPDADLKIYLEASAEERARRRFLENQARGENPSYDLILKNVKERDQIDSGRDVAPLRAAEDAIVIDSDRLSIDEVVAQALNLVDSWQK